MFVGVCRFSLFFPHSGSLKAKRQQLRKLIDRLTSNFNVAVAEVAGQDTWQRAQVAAVVVGNNGGHVQNMLDKVARYAEELYIGEMLQVEHDIVQYSPDEPLCG